MNHDKETLLRRIKELERRHAGWTAVSKTGKCVDVVLGGIVFCLILDEAEDLWRKLGDVLHPGNETDFVTKPLDTDTGKG